MYLFVCLFRFISISPLAVAKFKDLLQMSAFENFASFRSVSQWFTWSLRVHIERIYQPCRGCWSIGTLNFNLIEKPLPSWALDVSLFLQGSFSSRVCKPDIVVCGNTCECRNNSWRIPAQVGKFIALHIQLVGFVLSFFFFL